MQICPFFQWVLCFLNIELNELFVCFGDQSLVRPTVCKYFLPSHVLSCCLWYLAGQKLMSHICFFLYSFLSFFVAVLGLLAERALSGCSAWASHCSGSSCCRAQAPGLERAASPGFRALGHRLSSRGTGALLLCPTWHLPESGTEPVSAALVGGFFTTEPPGKPCFFLLFWETGLSDLWI